MDLHEMRNALLDLQHRSQTVTHMLEHAEEQLADFQSRVPVSLWKSTGLSLAIYHAFEVVAAVNALERAMGEAA